MNDYQLSEYAKSCALDIVAEFKRQYPGESVSDNRDDLSDQIHEHADGSEHVIYYHKAHAICQNCNTDDGEQFLEEMGNPDPCTYDSLATVIAYGELRARIETALNELIEESE